VPETLVAALDEFEREYISCINDPAFKAELKVGAAARPAGCV
jgi:hypothetical protein